MIDTSKVRFLASSKCQTLLYKDTASSFFYELIDKFPTSKHQYPALFRHFEREVAKLENPLKVDLPKGFIHRDVFSDNTIFREGKLKAMIDFEYACVDHFRVEIGAAISGFCYPNNRLDRELVNCLISSYQEVRKLTEQELELLDDYIRYGVLFVLSWHLKKSFKNQIIN